MGTACLCEKPLTWPLTRLLAPSLSPDSAPRMRRQLPPPAALVVALPCSRDELSAVWRFAQTSKPRLQEGGGDF